MGFRTQYEEARKRGGIAHRKEKSWWEEEQQRKMQLEQEQENENEKDQERDQDHIMEDAKGVRKEEVVSGNKNERDSRAPMSMEVDEPTQRVEAPTNIASANGEKQDGLKLTPAEEEDMQVVVQFFLDGGDSGDEPEEQVWARLEQKVSCTSLFLEVKSLTFMFRSSVNQQLIGMNSTPDITWKL